MGGLSKKNEQGEREGGESLFSRVDWMLLVFALPISIAGLVTMQSYAGGSIFFYRQLAFLAIAVGVFLFFALLDSSVFKMTSC